MQKRHTKACPGRLPTCALLLAVTLGRRRLARAALRGWRNDALRLLLLLLLLLLHLHLLLALAGLLQACRATLVLVLVICRAGAQASGR